jgi:hypothetical protein
MTTVSELIAKVESKKCKFEYHTRVERMEFPLYNLSNGTCAIGVEYRPEKTYFGLEYRPWIWVWFSVFEDGTAMCEEVYSMRTGLSNKSFRRCFNVERSLLK